MGMPVSELTQRMSHEELASWAAYESAVGPVGTERIEAMMARMSEQMHEFNWWYAQKNFHGNDGEGVLHLNPLGENPWDKGRVPRPGSDWKFGQTDVIEHRLSIQQAVHLNAEHETEDGEAE